MDKIQATETGILSDALHAAGHHLPMPCRGRQTCGKCGLYVAGETEPPSEQEAKLLSRISQPELPGFEYRLACLAKVRGTVGVIASSISEVAVADVGVQVVEYDGDAPETLGCAVDIGTTTVTLLLFRLGTRERVATVSQLNHQTTHGSDVLSRIDAAGTVGVAPLQKLIVNQLNAMLETALAEAGAEPTDVTRVTVTGNTTMLHLLSGREVASLGVYPFTPLTLFGYTRPATVLFPGFTNAELYLPPGISTYVGPDVTCGILATGLGARGEAELLVDIGTNGEMALAAGGRMWCCATAAGPAFEGAEISSGMPALPGAIEDVWVEDGEIKYDTIGHKRAKGLCGTGLIAVVDAYLDLGVIDGTGAMPDGQVVIGRSGIGLTQVDVRKLQLAKSAIAAGIDTLIAEAGLEADDLATLYIAGGFGSYLQAGPAVGIGLIPEVLAERSDPAGNTALTGAVLLTLSNAARAIAEKWASETEEVQLATNSVWMDSYIDNMAFRGDDDD